MAWRRTEEGERESRQLRLEGCGAAKAVARDITTRNSCIRALCANGRRTRDMQDSFLFQNVKDLLFIRELFCMLYVLVFRVVIFFRVLRRFNNRSAIS